MGVPRPGGTARQHADDDRRKVSTLPSPPNAFALGQLGQDYGLTWPQDIVYQLSAVKSGGDWVPEVIMMTGRYSRQVQLVTGPGGVPQLDIPSANIATQANFQMLINSLDALGTPGNAFTHYSLAAVQAHEDQHANRVRLALENQERAIERLFEAITVPINGPAESVLNAVGRIQADPRYAVAVANAFTLWDQEFDNLIAGDHNGSGPCEIAERRVTTGLKAAIQAVAVTQRWVAPPQPLAGAGVAPGGVAALLAGHAAGPAVAPPRAPIVLPGGSTRASQVRQWPPPPGG